MKHAMLSASGSSRWLNCLGSVILSKDIPKQPSSPAAEYGTRGHEIAEHFLKNDLNISDIDTGKIKWFPLTIKEKLINFDEEDYDFLTHIQFYVDVIRSMDIPFVVEQKLPLEFITNESNAEGTADAILFAKDRLIVVDLKMGLSRVEVKDNTQLMLYGLSAWHEFGLIHDYQIVELIIVQPRLGIVDRIEYSIEELSKFHKEVISISSKIHAMIAKTIPIEYAPNPKTCQWCEAKALCPSLANKMFDVIQDKSITLSELAPWTDIARKWADSIDIQVFNELSTGNNVEGYKLVKGRRGNRKWKDEDLAKDWLTINIGEKMYKHTIISPADADKILGKSILPKELTLQEEGKNVVVLENDKREKIVVQMF